MEIIVGIIIGLILGLIIGILASRGKETGTDYTDRSSQSADEYIQGGCRKAL
jgi:F0F1-type ATP synthase assembly protein I